MVSQRKPETGDLDPGECVGVGSAAGDFSLLKTAGGIAKLEPRQWSSREGYP